MMYKFKSAYTYIDDLCWINTCTPMEFLSLEQLRTPENPFWIYPLDVLEIKSEVSKFDENDPFKGIQAHFVNLEISVTDPHNGTFVTYKYDK